MAQMTVATDHVTQEELKILLDMQHVSTRIHAQIRRRLLDGATVEPGSLTVDADPDPTFDGELDFSSLYEDGIDIHPVEEETRAA